MQRQLSYSPTLSGVIFIFNITYYKKRGRDGNNFSDRDFSSEAGSR